jgi:hypothetical protein
MLPLHHTRRTLYLRTTLVTGLTPGFGYAPVYRRLPTRFGFGCHDARMNPPRTSTLRGEKVVESMRGPCPSVLRLSNGGQVPVRSALALRSYS